MSVKIPMLSDKNQPYTWKRFFVDLLCKGIIVFIIFRFILCIAVVYGASMEPTYYDGAYLLANRLDDGTRGDIVLAREDTYGVVVKRVLAIGGDSICIENGQVYVNGEALDEVYVVNFDANDNMDEITLPAGTYFLAGDNRIVSLDSRCGLGLFNEDDIVGTVLFDVGGKKP